MWLLKTGSPTLELVECMGDASEPYAILSHTWGQGEILFRDLGAPNLERKAGYEKVLRSVNQARSDGFGYLWVDTCCIDKASSAELSEAINSMYSWYQRAAICYAYLADVEAVSELEDSRWFRRGWTLQELIAPKTVHFFSKEWKFIGDKVTLSADLAAITTIDPSILSGDVSLSAASVAKRMSWAARRQTTRIEDLAYCLLGIFEVNMPLLYGEREKAFVRLQQEILKTTNDQSIFAWKDDEAAPGELRGMLATNPMFFHESASVIAWVDPESKGTASMVDGRLDVELRLKGDNTEVYWAALSCSATGLFARPLAIKLKQVSERRNEYVRAACGVLASVPIIGTLSPIHVPQTRTTSHSAPSRITPHYFLTLGEPSIEVSRYEINITGVDPCDNITQDLSGKSLDPAISEIGQWWKLRGYCFHFRCSPLPRVDAIKVTLSIQWNTPSTSLFKKREKANKVDWTMGLSTSGLLVANEHGADFEIVPHLIDRGIHSWSFLDSILVKCTTRPTLINCDKPFVTTIVAIHVYQNPELTKPPRMQ